MTVKIQNWKGSISYDAARVEVIHSVEQLVAIVTDPGNYPSPVRARGSQHSTTACIVAESGTVVDMRQMNRIVAIDPDSLTIRMQAGVQHIDAAKALEKQGLQFYVNVELGNLTIGSAACGGTKDASYISGDQVEYGQVAAYCIAVTTVQADGSLLHVTESDGELMTMMRSSYGMLGVIVEATFRVKRIKPLAVEHRAYRAEDFVQQLPRLLSTDRSMMLYLFPFLDKVVVEYRFEGKAPMRSGSWQWRLRNWVWKTGSPGFARIVNSVVPGRAVRSWIFDRWNALSIRVMTCVLRGCHTSPADQIIRYPETAGFASYTFSIWAFPQADFGQTLLDYFQFCRRYYQRNGYRCDLLNVGYSLCQDRQSNFSYSRHGPVLTLDPVSTGSDGWIDFLTAYNAFCSQHDGVPLFNQTRGLTHEQTQKAFDQEIGPFLAWRQRLDPQERFYTPYFRELLQQGTDIEMRKP